MASLSSEFVALIARAVNSDGISTTLKELFSVLKLPESELILDNVESIKEVLESVNFELIPSLASGSLISERILRSKNRPPINEEIARSEISNGENTFLEFKSSMLYDHKKAKAVPNLSINEYLSEDVLLSCLKTIAAFLTTDGGILYIGVEDDGNCIGLEHDCRIIGHKTFDADKWQLKLRSYFTGRFKDGKVINDYVDVTIIGINGVSVARLKVLPRRKLSFVIDKETKKPLLFRRQGNQTAIVEIDEVEDFLSIRALRI